MDAQPGGPLADSSVAVAPGAPRPPTRTASRLAGLQRAAASVPGLGDCGEAATAGGASPEAERLTQAAAAREHHRAPQLPLARLAEPEDLTEQLPVLATADLGPGGAGMTGLAASTSQLPHFLALSTAIREALSCLPEQADAAAASGMRRLCRRAVAAALLPAEQLAPPQMHALRLVVELLGTGGLAVARAVLASDAIATPGSMQLIPSTSAAIAAEELSVDNILTLFLEPAAAGGAAAALPAPERQRSPSLRLLAGGALDVAETSMAANAGDGAAAHASAPAADAAASALVAASAALALAAPNRGVVSVAGDSVAAVGVVQAVAAAAVAAPVPALAEFAARALAAEALVLRYRSLVQHLRLERDGSQRQLSEMVDAYVSAAQRVDDAEGARAEAAQAVAALGLAQIAASTAEAEAEVACLVTAQEERRKALAQDQAYIALVDVNLRLRGLPDWRRAELTRSAQAERRAIVSLLVCRILASVVASEVHANAQAAADRCFSQLLQLAEDRVEETRDRNGKLQSEVALQREQVTAARASEEMAEARAATAVAGEAVLRRRLGRLQGLRDAVRDVAEPRLVPAAATATQPRRPPPRVADAMPLAVSRPLPAVLTASLAGLCARPPSRPISRSAFVPPPPRRPLLLTSAPSRGGAAAARRRPREGVAARGQDLGPGRK